MKFNLNLVLFSCLIVITSCNQKVTNQEDYVLYLNTDVNPDIEILQKDIQFWSDKLTAEPTQFPYLIKRSGVYAQLFSLTGDISFLIKAEDDGYKANDITNFNNVSYLKTLARIYISQHKFKEALSLLQKAEQIGDQLSGTQKMLFDVHLELGNSVIAESYLKKIKNNADFDFLIRMAKFKDHEGDLSSAITYMEKAKTIADASGLKGIKQWAYTNLADFYGHDGRISDSYNYFLKALQLDPNDAYAKKGIAWIAYSNDKNTNEAIRILNSILKYHRAPEYYLLLSEVAEHAENSIMANVALENYNKLLENKSYGDMYNKYQILILADQKDGKEKALELAKIEVENRPTAESYFLLACSHFQNGAIEKAKSIALEYVDGKTSEPEVLYHLAEIYKANGDKDRVKPIKKELIGSLYELGPQMATKINQL
ncbi:tetratricopeptide repeat protein [Paucihalobacter sp.]|uniref:tetratricopeptide repeat protein n=1 Tax=Paucihalobacter sp. TaxID=2850405 RepID=UPI002FE2C891